MSGPSTPTEDSAYTLVAESIDCSGMGRATMAPRLGMQAPVPPLRPKPVLSMKDMCMGGMDHGAMGHGSMQGMDHGSGGSGMSHDMRDESLVPPDVKVGVGVDMIAPMPVDPTGDKALGVEGEVLAAEGRILPHQRGR